jgi:hypothetical protein
MDRQHAVGGRVADLPVATAGAWIRRMVTGITIEERAGRAPRSDTSGLNVPFGMGAEAESQFIGGDQPVVGDAQVHLGDIGGDVEPGR